MNMGSTTMAMATTTAAMDMSGHAHGAASAAAPTSTGMAMGGMGGMGGGSGCKISMLWNWYTIDSCFIARSWRIRSNGMFAGSCIGVILLVMLLEFLRRSAIEYDAFIVKKYATAAAANSGPVTTADSASGSSNPKDTATATAAGAACAPRGNWVARPNVVEQLIRAFLHMAQFTVAYFVMLLAMYYNGYILICIFLGAGIGFFVFNWRNLASGQNGTPHSREVTYCCG